MIAIFALTGVGASAGAQAPCSAGSVYLTFDTGHMGIAPLVAEVLKRHDVRVTFFAANEKTKEGDGSLGAHWGAWWKARGAEGHEFASHTYDHAYWRGDLPGVATEGRARFRIRPTAGAFAGREFTWTTQQYCDNIAQAAERLTYHTGKPTLPIYRAPGGKTSPRLLAAAKSCGYTQIGWTPNGFLGDELSSSSHPNAALLKKALATIRDGDVLLAHLGIWSRQDPWAPAVLEPLITGLKAKGLCFKTISQHPRYADWLAGRAQPPLN